MNKIIPIISFLVLLTYSLLGQTEVAISDVTSPTGEEVLVPINATVNDLASVNLNVKYDSTVLTFVEVANNNLGGSLTIREEGDSLISLGWYSDTPVDIATKILDLKFVYNGGTSAVKFVGNNRLADGLQNQINTVFFDGSVGPEPISIDLSDETGVSGDTVEVDLTAVNLENIGSMNLYIDYDDSKATFLGLGENEAGFTPPRTDIPNRVELGMFSADGFNHSSGVLATLRFVIIAGNTDLEFDVASRVRDINNNFLLPSYTGGSVGEVDATFLLENKIAISGTEVVISLNALKISDIGTFNIDVLFDSSILEYVRVENVVGGSISGRAINGILSLGYFSPDGLTVVDGLVADLVFNYSGGTSAVSFDVGTARLLDVNNNPVTVDYVDGSVEELFLPSFVNTLPDTTVEVLTMVDFLYTGTHPNNVALTFSLVSGPDGATIDTAGQFSWMPVNGDAGNHDIVVGLSDGVTTVIDSTLVTVTGQVDAVYPVIEAATDGTLDQPWRYNDLGAVGTIVVEDSTASAWGSHVVKYTDNAYTGLALINKVFTESYTVSSDIYLIGEQDADFPLYTGIAIKAATAELKYYRFIYRNSTTDMGQLKLQGYDGASWHISKTWNVGEEIDQLATGWHNFKITIDGDKFYVYMDGELLSGSPILVTGDAAFLTDGMPGIFVYNGSGGSVTFDNFKVEENVQLEYTIAEIQTPVDSTGSSPLDGMDVITSGVVTAVDLDGDGAVSQFFVQDGSGAYNGILVYSAQVVAVGDSVRFQGEVDEYYGKTELKNVSGLTILALGVALPAAVALTTAEVNNEMYEGVLVSIANAVNVEENSDKGEAKFDDGSGVAMTDDMLSDAFPFVLGNIYDITGIVDYSWNNYKILYRDSSDVVDKGAELEGIMTLDHNTGNLVVSVFNNGTIGANRFDGKDYGVGVEWKGTNGLWRGGIVYGSTMIGYVNGQAYNYNSANFFDMVGVESDFTSGFYEETMGSVTFDQVSESVITDENADNPFGFNVIQKTYSKTGEDVVYISYGLINTLGQSIPATFAGIFMDYDIGNAIANSGGIAVDEHLVYQYEPGTTEPYFGLVALNGLDGGMVTADNAATVEDLRKAGMGFISNGGDNTDPGSGDQRSWIGSSLGTLTDGDTTWVTFAIVAGDDLHDIRFLSEKAFILGEQAGLTDIKVGVEEETLEIPMKYEISQNYPNPFNPATIIQYALPLQSHVKINVYNTLGQLVTKLVNSDITAGYHEVQFNASNLSSGVYFYSIQAESIDGSKNFQIVKKMMLVK